MRQTLPHTDAVCKSHSPMEKLTLTSHENEIIVNNGATEGAVDLFCYRPEESASRHLGSLYVVGHRINESSNMGYMVSLIAALARREYYAQPGSPPKEAFNRTLRKANEVVEEFFRSGDIKLSVGILAITGGQIMVSKLDKFKIFLAREDQVIDIMSNVMLFTKEHSDRQRFSNIIHGSIQAGDRILAFVPTRGVTSREKSVKNWFLQLPQQDFAQRISRIGQQHATFATAMLHVAIDQVSEPALMPSTQPHELAQQEEPLQAPQLANSESNSNPISSLAWAPRQQPLAPQHQPAEIATLSASQNSDHHAAEMPRIISSEFSLGTRRTHISRLLARLSFIRLDGRGKAFMLVAVVAVITGSLLFAKSVFVSSPQEQSAKATLIELRHALDEASSQAKNGNTTVARSLLTKAISSVAVIAPHTDDATALSSAMLSALDTIDDAQPVEPKLIATSDEVSGQISMATWSSSSQEIVVIGLDTQNVAWQGIVHDTVTQNRSVIQGPLPDRILSWGSSTIIVHFQSHSITRMLDSKLVSYIIPMQDEIRDVAVFGDNVYVLTTTSILKISDLDTEKVVMKRWLETDDQLTPNASRIVVDGSVYTMTDDGVLTTYYKGKRSSVVTTPVTPAGAWRLLPTNHNELAVVVGDTRRVYHLNAHDGSLSHVEKVDSTIPFSSIAQGQEDAILFVTSEGKLWELR